MRVLLADFSRAREFAEQPDPLLEPIMCTLGYCAPERLLRDVAKSPHGPEVDVWSFGAILYELLITNPFVNADFRKDEASGTLALACVLRRLGPPPAGSAYRLSAGVVGRAASLDLKPLQEESFEWKEGAPAAALGAVLRWEWAERASAGDASGFADAPRRIAGCCVGSVACGDGCPCRP